jgi:hypothetical protein
MPVKNPARKFSELIHAASSKWANWDPPHQIKVGDYGTVERETGNLQKEGNIYEDKDAIIANLAVQHLPLTGAPDDQLIISSAGVVHHELNVAAEGGVVGLANASIKGQWKFGNRRGALLVMSQPLSSYLPPQVLLKHLVDIPIFKDKVLVTEVISCPAYSLYLSTASNEAVELALIGTTPIPPGLTVGGGVGASWWSRNYSGMFRQACDRDGLYRYTPLYTLKKIRQKHLLRRESTRPDPVDDDLWIDVQEPWDPLDDEGEEVAFDGSISE